MRTIFEAGLVSLLTVFTLCAADWRSNFTNVPYDKIAPVDELAIEILIDGETGIKQNRSTIGQPLVIGETEYTHGLGMHAPSHVRIHSPQKIVRFESWVGIDKISAMTGDGSVDFIVQIPGTEPTFQKNKVTKAFSAQRIDLKIDTHDLDLIVGDGGDGVAYDHADWGNAVIHLDDGTICRLGEMQMGPRLPPMTNYPFSFIYNGTASDELLPQWKKTATTKTLDANRKETTTQWTDPETGLRVEWSVILFNDYPAVDSLLHFENTGTKDTSILDNIQALSYSLTSPLQLADPSPFPTKIPYLLYRTNGSPSTPDDFAFSLEPIDPKQPRTLKAGGGRSSNQDFPFYKIEHSRGSFITAVGWSGQWKSSLICREDGRLDMTAGLEKTHFKLHPGERVRMPRMLLFNLGGDTWESNAQFRQLIYKHYAAKRGGKSMLPIPFCNTCFTRGGGWLNETTAENQISLINSYADLGVKSIITDAGWFIGGWPNGAGNWTPDPEKYPGGMGPVAKAALDRGGIYGLWFEPERVVAGTPIHKEHPEWVLSAHDGPNGTYLFNMGNPDARKYFFNIVKGFMDLPGFEVYRQDFNMDPLSYWLYSDAPDRQGMTELKYIEGLYLFWDEIAKNYPDSLREECASGGRRIDLETVMRMHIHQDSDYWFQWDTDQNQIWGMGQYLPNNVFVSHLHSLDDYGFTANMAASLCLGWIADDPKFDRATAKKMMDRYLAYRDLFIGAWYPLLISTKDDRVWMGSKYYRKDEEKGIVIVQRRKSSPYAAIDVKLRGLDADAKYRVIDEKNSQSQDFSGTELMEKGFRILIEDTPGSAVYLYEKY